MGDFWLEEAGRMAIAAILWESLLILLCNSVVVVLGSGVEKKTMPILAHGRPPSPIPSGALFY